VAWHAPTWEGWGERTAEENRALRESLLERGEYDGYLVYVDDEPAGWCQAGPRDRLEKLARQFALPPDPQTWAITCFQIAPAYRRKGLATTLLREVLRDLRARGVRRVEAFPKRGEALDVDDLWNGPEAMFRAAGFTVMQDDPVRPVLRLEM
jgi:ribosomal protein S18 acetylase RimI-like enzyme